MMRPSVPATDVTMIAIRCRDFARRDQALVVSMANGTHRGFAEMLAIRATRRMPLLVSRWRSYWRADYSSNCNVDDAP